MQFKCPPFRLFQDTPVASFEPNVLVIRIQPDEGIALRFQAKIPGAEVMLGGVEMDFDYADHFAAAPATGYETLLYDCLNGDATLFHRADMVEAGWQVVAPILDLVRAEPTALLHDYPAFSSGPAASEALLARDGRAWRHARPRMTAGRGGAAAARYWRVPVMSSEPRLRPQLIDPRTPRALSCRLMVPQPKSSCIFWATAGSP